MNRAVKPDSTVTTPSNLWPDQATVLGVSQLSDLSKKLLPIFTALIEQEKLDKSILPQLNSLYLPLAACLAGKHSYTPIVVGINGAQGAGKSTLSKILKALLAHGFDKSVVHLSIDDLYLSRQRREALAQSIHPLFKTRGVPGTHDVELGKTILSALTRGDSALPIKIPVFDKAQDDLLPESEWLLVDEPVDIVLFEGWCVGSRAQNQQALNHSVNDLEQNEDEHAVWRKYVNAQLEGPYQELFGLIDCLVMLKVPDMESVFEWRNLQEEKLQAHCEKERASTSKLMSEAEVKRFIMHFERITRESLKEMPDRADVLLALNKHHQVNAVRVASQEGA